MLLLDYKMPGLTGLEILERVQAMKLDLVTIMITAFASIETAVSATKQGAFDFLAKPFTPKELRSTVQKAANHLLVQRHARKLEAEKRQLRFQLISVVTHELKSPLGVVENFLEVLKDPKVRQDDEKTVHFIQRGIIRLQGMRKLITDLLDLTRIESGQKRRELAWLDIVPLVRSCLEGAETMGRERAIRVESHLPESLEMRADGGEIEIILNNLLSNAVKYNRDGGEVRLTLDREGEQVVIEVADTGIGMTTAEQARLFREFSRIKNKRTKRILGSGLGLSIVKKLAAFYGGMVRVASEPDVGSTFTVYLERDRPNGTS